MANELEVEVFSNLVHVKPAVWNALTQPGVQLATSYYSADRKEHLLITGRPSHSPTKKNIKEAVDRGIPVRAGIIGIFEDQDIEGARQELINIGVNEANIGVDYLRQVGRGTRDQEPSVDQLCGNCADGALAIMPDGTVNPCVFSRWGEFEVGNVRTTSLRSILEGDDVRRVRGFLEDAFAAAGRPLEAKCDPKKPPEPCNPTCRPKQLCNPLQTCKPACPPVFNCPPASCRPACRPHVATPCQPECMPRCIPKRKS